ncbi:MAG: hypothetical protein ACRD3M_19280 [Thermoanaerobaculia bacterium]
MTPNPRLQRTPAAPLSRQPFGVTKLQLRVIVATLVLLLGSTVIAGPAESRLRLFFPEIKLDREVGERIQSLSVRMTCGRFRGVRVIPKDWSVTVVSPSSEQTSLETGAGHGSTTLWSLNELDGSIVVSAEEASCFGISATVTSTKRLYQFDRSELALKP